MSGSSGRSEAMHFRAQLFEDSIRLQEESLGDLLDTLESRRAELAKAFRGVSDGDTEYLEHLESQAADLNAWSVDMAELTMVATYHWLERELKIMAAWLPYGTVMRTQTLDAQGLAKSFAKAGLDLHKVTGYEDLNVLRLFANSWKHNPRRPSQDLLRAIGLSPSPLDYGLLSSERVEQRLREVLTIAGTDVTCFDISRAMINRVRGFLLEVFRAAPFRGWPREQPNMTSCISAPRKDSGLG